MTLFDYAIIGAGSAGCVLANRLTEDLETSVCLIEAGGASNSPLLHVPAGWAATFNHKKFDWCYKTEPEPELNGREINWPRGKTLGGSSAINGMIYIRGVPMDFAAWEQAGAKGWSWEEVLPYFKKAEKQKTHHDEMHGVEGPLHVQDVRDRRSVHETFLNAMEERGIPRTKDFNGQLQEGCGYYQFTQNNGRRWSTASAYLGPAKQRRNLTIRTQLQVAKVLVEDRKAVGVLVAKGTAQETIRARHIILCSGAIGSPQILELSGIGDKERLQGLGIESVRHLPEVGENLQDHLLSKVVFGTTPENSINREVQGPRLISAAAKWFFNRSGPLTAGSAPVGAFWYTREGLEAPDIQIHFASGATLYNNEGKIRPLGQAAMTAVVNQSRPESRGSIHIHSADRNDSPTIQANYLSTELDRRTMVKGMQLLMQVFESPVLKEHVTGRLSPSADLNIEDEAAILEYVREDASTVYHPTSTCSIGKVVNENLLVDGVENLSVVDASVMPYVVSGNTNAATIMLAEKNADFLKATITPGLKRR